MIFQHISKKPNGLSVENVVKKKDNKLLMVRVRKKHIIISSNVSNYSDRLKLKICKSYLSGGDLSLRKKTLTTYLNLISILF